MQDQRPPYVYALASDGDDHFAEMVVISARTLLQATPGAQITLLSDQHTEALKTPAVRQLKSLVTDWRTVNLDDESIIKRSRQLKLRALEIIQGGYVFLDADTLIARDITAIADHKGELAAVRDGDRYLRPELAALAGDKGWAVPERYMNSGVYSVRDTPETRRVFETAYAIWEEASQSGAYNDQYALNIALQRLDFPVTWLSSSYNLQLLIRPGAVMRPHVYHVFSIDFENRDDTLLHLLARELKCTGNINEALLETFFETRNPWTHPTQPGELWSLGRPVAAVRAKLRKLFSEAAGAP